MSAQKRFAPRIIEVPLLSGEDQNEVDRLKRAVDAAMASSGGTKMLTDRDDLPPAVEAFNAFLVEAEERAEKVHVRKIGRTRWWELAGQFPLREDNKGDQVAGYNLKDFPDAVLAEPATFADEDLADPEDRREFLDDLTDGDWQRIVQAVWAANLGHSAVPKALTLADLTDGSETSNSPAATAPLSDASGATNPSPEPADTTGPEMLSD